MSFKTVLSENQLGSRGELLMIEFRFKVYPVFFCLILVSLWSRACDKRDIECFLRIDHKKCWNSIQICCYTPSWEDPVEIPMLIDGNEVKSWVWFWSMMLVKSMARSQHQWALLGVIHLGCPAKLGLQINAASVDIWLQVPRVLSSFKKIIKLINLFIFLLWLH